jgi:outer membrane protein insertion porin family
VQAIFDDFLIEEARAIVRGALGAEGYLEPMLTVGITMDTDKVLAIGIEPGPRTGRRVLAVDADDAALEDAVEDHLEDSPLVDDAWRDPEPLRQDVLRFVRSRGHLAAEVTIAAPSVGDGVATLPIAIAAGPVFTIEDLRVEGTGPRAPAAAFEIGHLDLGAPYNPVEVDVERRRLAAEYRRAGFASARVAANPMVNGETRRVAVVFTVNEGPQQVLQEIVIEGNTGIDDDVITRALDLRIGEPVGGDAWLQARARVFETGLFQRADVNVEPIAPDAAGPEQPVRARVTVREWPALRVRYGLRLAEERPIDDVEGREITPGFSADITRQTLFGRAIALGTSVDYQRRFRQARLFGGTPTLFGLPVESIVSFVRSHENRESVTLLTDRTGISWEQRVRLVPNLRLSYSYTYDRDRTFDTEPPSPGLPAFDITVNIARVTLASIWDTRNDPGDAQTGTFLSATGEHAPGHLGSDIRFIRLLGQAYHFRPWNRLTLASAARVGVVSPLSGQVLIPSERFYSGGARSVRGVAEDSLGGTDFEGFPFGGRALLILNQEVRVPIWGWLRGVGFVDAGNVFEEPGDLRFRDLVGSAGAGLRLATPVAMFRVDYARLWASSPEQRVARWTFGIGQAF